MEALFQMLEENLVTAENPLVDLSAAMDQDACWHAACRLLTAVLPPLRSISMAFFPPDGSRSCHTREHVTCHAGAARSRSGQGWRAWEINPLRRYLETNPQTRVFPLDPFWPDEGRMRASPYFAEVMEPGGWRHGLFFFLMGRSRLRALVAVYRSAEQGPFLAREIKLAENLLHPHLQTALRRVIDLNRKLAEASSLARFLTKLDRPVLILDWELTPVFSSPSGRAFCMRWSDGLAAPFAPKASLVVPPGVRTVCLQQKAEWSAEEGKDGIESPRKKIVPVRVLHPEEGGMSALVHGVAASGLSLPTFHVSFEDRGVAKIVTARPATNDATLLDGLTSAEKEIVRMVCSGLANKEIADHQNKSLSTVKKQLNSVFSKTGVRSRSELISRIQNGRCASCCIRPMG